MTLRVGFLGTGAWSRAHLYRVQQHADVVVTACYGSNPDKTRAFQQAAGADCIVYPTYADMFPHVDALYVVLPPFAHTGQVGEAIAAGVHVFAEKPLARTLEQAQRYAEIADAHPDVRTQIGYMLRFGLPAKVMGDFALRRGRPILFLGRYFCNSLHAHWWRDHARSGGQLLEQVIHLIDLACLLLGDPREVSLQRENIAHRHVEGYTTDDVSVLTVRFASGAIGVFAATNCAVPETWEMEYRVVFERMTVASNTVDSARFWVYEPDFSEEFVADVAQSDRAQEAYAEETADFLGAIREGRPTRCPIREGLTALRVIEAAETSVERRGPVVVP
jgi:predicted dehydrogenase